MTSSEGPEIHRLLFERAPVGIVVTDLDGRIVGANDTFASIAAREGDDLRGVTWEALVHVGDRDALRRMVTAAREGQPGVAGHQRYLGPEGEVQAWATVAAAGEEPGVDRFLVAVVQRTCDLPAGGRVVGTDVGGDAVPDSTRLREDLLSGISHDMQTPLAAISGIADVLADGAPLDADQQRSAFQTLQRQAGALQRLVQQFLDFSRLEANRELVLRRAPTDVEAVARRVARLFAHERAVEVDADVDLPRPVSDPDRVQQVLANLVSNAVKFSVGPVRIEIRRRGGGVEAAVVDDGVGVAPADRQRIFEKFVRGANAGSRPGSGLGLYVSRAIVDALGGELAVGSEPAGGSRFTIVLPATHDGGF